MVRNHGRDTVRRERSCAIASGCAGRCASGRTDVRAGREDTSARIGFRFGGFGSVGAEWANQCFARKRLGYQCGVECADWLEESEAGRSSGRAHNRADKIEWQDGYSQGIETCG